MNKRLSFGKKKLFSFLIPAFAAAVIILLSPLINSQSKANAAWNGEIAGSYYSGGSGTQDSPYTIPDGSYLAALASAVNAGNNMSGKYFVLTADIDLGGDALWTPIGTDSNSFKGVFNGKNYTVSNLMYRGGSLTNNNVGLFGVCRNAAIFNLKLSNIQIYCTKGYVGALCGNAHGCTVSNVNVTGVLQLTGGTTSSIAIGGMFGRINSPSTITNCTVAPTSNSVGYHTVKGYDSFGGFVGDIKNDGAGANVTITDCTVKNVAVIASLSNTSGSRAGGFFGDINRSNIPNVTFTRCSVVDSSVSGELYTGGFGFYLRSGSTMNCCYVANTSLNDIYANAPSWAEINSGGLLGVLGGNLQNSYCFLSSYTMSSQTTPSYFGYSAATEHNVGLIAGVRKTGATASNVYYIIKPLTLGSGVSTLTLDSSNSCVIGSSLYEADVYNGKLGYNLTNESAALYWTQKDNAFIHSSTFNSNTVKSYPIPGNASNRIVFTVIYGVDNTGAGSQSKFCAYFDGSYNASQNTSGRADIYLNAGTTPFERVETQTAGRGYTWYFTVRNSSGNITTYGIEDINITIPSDSQIRINFHGETEKVFNITYRDSDGSAITPSAGAPTTFTLSNPADVTTVSATKAHWAHKCWNKQNGLAYERVNSVTPSEASYADITLYADWELATEVGADGKTYRLIYDFDNLFSFRDRVNSGENTLNAKLCPDEVSYYTLTIKPGKTGTTYTFSTVLVTTTTLVAQTSTQKTTAELYIMRAILLRAGEDVSTPEKYATVYNALTSKELAALNRQVAAQMAEIPLTWGNLEFSEPIGKVSYYLGTFDGNGNTISGLTLGGTVSASKTSFGLFKNVGSATIKNLTLSGGSLTLSGTDVDCAISAAALVTNAAATTISGCTVSVPINTAGLTLAPTSYRSINIGAMVATGGGTISDCTVTSAITLGTLSGTSSQPVNISVGGFIGSTTPSYSTAIARSLVSGAVSSSATYSAGITLAPVVGTANGAVTITDCAVSSNVSFAATSGTVLDRVSGFVGWGSTLPGNKVTFNRCCYYGKLTLPDSFVKSNYSAFIGGVANTVSITDCYFDGDKSSNDLRHGTAVSTSGFTGGSVSNTLQKAQPDTSVLVWGQKYLTSGGPIPTSDPSYTVRKVKAGDSFVYTLGKPLGDTDSDFEIGDTDYTRAVKGVVGYSYEGGGLDNASVCDYNGDGVLDALDALLMQQVISGNTAP